MQSDFDELFERLDLCRSNLTLLNEEFARYSAEGFWIGPGFHFDPSMLTILAKQVKPVPLSLRVNTANIVHECRTCLDALAVILAHKNGRSDSGIFFPIFDHENQIDNDKQVKKKLNKFRECDRDLILSFKPWSIGKGGIQGNHNLVAMHKIDKKRKHIKMTAHSVSGSITISNGYVGRLRTYGKARLSEKETAIGEISKDSRVSLALMPHYRFADLGPLSLPEIPTALSQFIHEVTAIASSAKENA